MKKSQNVNYYVAGLISLLTFIIYLPALQNKFVAWDDNIYVFDNHYIRSLNLEFFKWAFSNFFAANWHPLTWISHALDYSVWGLNPLGHHLTNIIFHAVNTFVVVLLMFRLLETRQEPKMSSEAPGFLTERTILTAAGITGLLFGLHPLHVESVAWVSERKDLLCALFYLLTIIMYINHLNVREHQITQKKIKSFVSTKYYFSSCGFFILALLSKPMAVTLPVVLLILDWYPFQRIPSFQAFRQAVVEKIPFLALSLFSSIITILAQRAVGATWLTEAIPLPARVLVGAKSLPAYLWKMLWPLDLVPYYPYPEHISILSFEYLSAIGLVIGITVVCIVLAKKQKLWLTVWGIYVVMLLPVLGIVQVGNQSMADRYMYLPSLGPFLILGLTTGWISKKVNRLQKWRLVTKASVASAAVLVFAALSFLTYTQIDIWENDIDLWSYVIRREPEKVPVAYNNRGVAYENKGLFKKAIEDLDRAIILNPYYYLAYNNRGAVLGTIGQYDSALRDFTVAIAMNPLYYEAYKNRATTFEKMGQFKKALDDYNKAVTLNPSFEEAFYYMGVLYCKMGSYNEAIQTLTKSIALNPNHAEAYSNRGVMYSLGGQPENALEDYNMAIALNQNFATAYVNRGKLYLKIGRKDLASTDFQRACDLGDLNGCEASY
ncbi:MAG TPA: tetratricopeptide repeat protein [Nitrospirota bacterium]|nr:tetratricopeptide repeat protein [Nitrospirota bacterium]